MDLPYKSTIHVGKRTNNSHGSVMGNDRSSHADLGSLPKAQHDRDTELQPLGEFRYFLAEVSEPVLYVKI